MTRKELDKMWFQAMRTSIEKGDDFVRYDFAALVAAHEREKVAAWMLRRSYATGHGDTVEDLLDELEWQVAAHEREACAEIADKELDNTMLLTSYPPKSSAAWNIRAAIRARGER